MVQTKTCTACKIEKSVGDFYKSKTHRLGLMCYCKFCFNQKVVARWVKRKKEAIKHKGSQCQRCGLHLENSHYAVFEFHHVDPSVKETDWSKLRMKSWQEVKEELDKCKLLCANCHRVVHAEDFPEQPKSHQQFPI
jgi:type II secretory ATPase GspE/PulE/Tfp pilus assembly ATPase PilB-like protein